MKREAQPEVHPFIRPPALGEGDVVGILAPSSGVQPAALAAGCERLRRMGYRPFHLPSILDQDLYFAGTLRRRVDELHEMFRRPEVRAILCARGGYGANYLLDHLDRDLVRANPKIFVGCSDVTFLLGWFANLGQVAFHGPMAAAGFAREDGVDEDSWHAVLGGQPCRLGFDAGSSVRPLVTGTASGILAGGCLSILAAALGTPHDIETAGRILFLEDVGTKPYQLDRMLMQLREAGKLEGVRGLVFGYMLDCEQPGGQSYTLQEVARRIVGDLGIPVAYGLPSGHVVSGNVTLPFGVQAELTVTDARVELSLEAATVAVPRGACANGPEPRR